MADRLEEMLREFHTAFEVKPDRELRLRLIREEQAEVVEAAQHLLKELVDLAYVLQAALNEGLTEAEIEAECPELPDDVLRLYEALSDRFDEAAEIVHGSNMSKLGEDGKPVRREDGKVLKGPFYQAPDLSHLIR